MNHVLIVSTPSMNALKERIVTLSHDGKIKEAVISWKTFEDGFPNLMIESVETFRGKDVIFLADFMDIKDIFAQLAGM